MVDNLPSGSLDGADRGHVGGITEATCRVLWQTRTDELRQLACSGVGEIPNRR